MAAFDPVIGRSKSPAVPAIDALEVACRLYLGDPSSLD
jgi:hypothetical protein